MKISSSRFFILLFQIVLFLGLTAFGVAYGQNQTINGTLTVTGSTALNSILTVTGASTFSGLTATGLINSTNNLLTFGTQGAQGSSFGSAFQYADNSVPASSTTVDSMTFVVDRYPGSWLWEHNTSTTSSVSAPAMRLDSSHSLLIFPTGATLTTPASITMTPAASPLLSLGTATLTATGTALSTNGALTVAGNITNTTGSITGGASGLSLNAGGTNQNVTLNSSGTGDLVFNAGGAERARIKSTGSIGIGTATPSEKLEVIGGIKSSGASVGMSRLVLQSTATGGQQYEWYNDYTGAGGGILSLYNRTANNNPITFSAAGNVGVGTTNPVEKLDIVGSAQISQGAYLKFPHSLQSDLNDGKIGAALFGAGLNLVGIKTDSTYRKFSIWGEITQLQNGGTNTWGGNNYFSGNVGIGTATPGAKLEITVPAGGADGIQITRASSSTWQLMNYGPFYIQEAGIGPRVVVASGGNVGIGTAAPQSKLHVYQSAVDSTGLILQGNTINGDALQHYIALTLDGDYGNATGNYSQIRSYSNLYSNWGSQLAFFTSKYGITNTLAERMRIDASGNVGIGTTSPGALLQIGSLTEATPATYTGSLKVTGPTATSLAAVGGIELPIAGDGYSAKIQALSASGSALAFARRNASATWIESMRIDAAGNVGIGTTNPTQKLAVAGTIRAYEVIVDTGWSDYVFDDNYKLKTLSETEAYIKTEKHLPGIPSAKEVAEHGVSMGEMESKLLAKVEELTLHLIEQEKQLAAQQRSMTAQQQEIAALRQQVTELNGNNLVQPRMDTNEHE